APSSAAACPPPLTAARSSLGGRAALGGAGVHPERLEVVAVRVVELPLVHEAEVLGLADLRARGGGPLDERVDLLLGRQVEGDERERRRRGVADRFALEEGAVEVPAEHHEELVLIDDDTGGVLVA